VPNLTPLVCTRSFCWLGSNPAAALSRCMSIRCNAGLVDPVYGPTQLCNMCALLCDGSQLGIAPALPSCDMQPVDRYVLKVWRYEFPFRCRAQVYIETLCLSKLVTYNQTARHHIPEDCNLSYISLLKPGLNKNSFLSCWVNWDGYGCPHFHQSHVRTLGLKGHSFIRLHSVINFCITSALEMSNLGIWDLNALL
jgi:hypothetical protein